jgi:hypothetical protein
MPGGCNMSGGVCDMPWGMLVRFWAMLCVPEWGRVEGIAIVNEHVVDDMAGCIDV